MRATRHTEEAYDASPGASGDTMTMGKATCKEWCQGQFERSADRYEKMSLTPFPSKADSVTPPSKIHGNEVRLRWPGLLIPSPLRLSEIVPDTFSPLCQKLSLTPFF